MTLTKAPSDAMKLLMTLNNAIGTTAEDLDSYIDFSAYEYLLVSLVSAKLGTETGADVTLTWKHADKADQSGTLANAKDDDGNNLSLALGGSAAAGRGASMVIRTHGLNKFQSPVLVATTAAVTVCLAVYGFNPSDTSGLRAHWTDEAGASVAGSTAWT